VKPWRTAWLALGSLSLGCGGGGGGGGGAAAPAPSPPTPPPVRAFLDVTGASNLAYVTRYTLPALGSPLTPEIAAITYGGAAAGDCDLDGDVDLFITYGDVGPNRLYLNLLDRGNPLLFNDEADRRGVAFTHSPGRNYRHSGPIFADMDGDADLDLFIGGLFNDASKVYKNLGDCSFLDVTNGSGLEALTTPHTISAAVGDYDLDGKADLFLTHWGSQLPGAIGARSEHLFRNVSDANGIRFENVSVASRVVEHLLPKGPDAGFADWTMTATIARINDDLWPDIAIASDFGRAQLFLGDPTSPGTFLDATNYAISSIDNAMGSALGDFDSDGDLDWFVTSIYGTADIAPSAPSATGNRLLRNPGGNLMSAGLEDVTEVAGVRDGMWGWAACFLDIDNDGDLDLYHTNGWPAPYYQATYHDDRSRAFVSNGQGQFDNRAQSLGLNDSNDGRGVVCADFDNDGDVDILQTTNNATNSVTLWANDSAASGRNFLRLRLVGLPPNTQAAGARIYAKIGSRTQMREIGIGSNYTSQNPMVQVLGLGTSASVDELRVEWPPLAPGPVQPAATVRTGVPASQPRTTLVICHPDLSPAPAICN
jgi:hypothetical protein